MLCETPTAGKLLTAAEERQDGSLLAQIRDKDLKALHACYHFTCYRDYTRCLYRNKYETPRTNVYENAYKYFCETVIEEKIFKNREAFRLSRLTMLFKDIVKEREGVDISTYTNQSLKARLQKSHPSLRFRKASQACSLFADSLAAGESRDGNATSTTSSSLVGKSASNTTQANSNSGATGP